MPLLIDVRNDIRDCDSLLARFAFWLAVSDCRNGVFLIGTPFSMYCGEAYCEWTGNAGVGLVVAGIAAVLPLIGIAYPRGVTRNLRLVPLKERFITFGLPVE